MSRFVSAGAINAETGEAVLASAEQKSPSATAAGEAAKKNTEWEAVQKELEAERRRREEARVKAVEGGGEKSLYDVLQANKAAKQAAFEEQNKIKNQFRPLDDDEIEFLDDVREKKRMEEEKVRRETEEGIAKFRRAQQIKRSGDGEAEDEVVEKGGGGTEEEWAVGPRKRRRKERGFGIRREKSGEKEKDSDDGGHDDGDGKGAERSGDERKEEGGKKVVEETSKGSPPAKPTVGLVAYGSDSDDE